MLPPNTYKVDDFETIRQTIFDDAYNALSKRFPLENDKYRLVVEDLGYDNIPKYTKLQQKEAIQSDKTLSAKLRGRWVLYDKATGKAVSRSPRKTIMDVPYMPSIPGHNGHIIIIHYNDGEVSRIQNLQILCKHSML